MVDSVFVFVLQNAWLSLVCRLLLVPGLCESNLDVCPSSSDPFLQFNLRRSRFGVLWSYLPFIEIVRVDDEGWGLGLVIVSDVRALPGWLIVVVL